MAAAGCLAAGLVLCADDWKEVFYIPPDDPAIQYDQRPSHDPVARLDERLRDGKARLDYAPKGLGYLPSLLAQLGINIDSQTLVFSRTSIQSAHISPAAPRAIYFNDDVAVGYVQEGDLLELTALDAEQGVLLYTLSNAKTNEPRIGRENDCLRCHQGLATLAVPGLLISSVHPRSDDPGEGHGSAFVTDDRTPLKQRWGGWYVTGSTGAQFNLGNNVTLADPLHAGSAANGVQNVTSLEKFVDTSRYLAPTSDVVALMTLEHQSRMTNLLVRVGWDARIAAAAHKTPEAIRREMEPEVEELVTYMLFADEAPLSSPVTGVSRFTKTFAQRGPRDSQGRSLRDFDLRTRLFRYPLSYMIYSAAFDGLPEIAREQIYARLYDVLSGKDQGPKFARISADDRKAVLTILRDTKPSLPAYWRAAAGH